MNLRIPSLRRHDSGQYMAKWGGKVHYFGHDEAEAQARYVENLQSWKAWRTERNALMKLPEMRAVQCVAEVADKFFESKGFERGTGCEDYYRKHLKRYLHHFGGIRIDTVRPSHLQSLKDQMIASRGYAPRTINHDLIAIKSFLGWAMGREYMAAIHLKGVKTLETGPAKHRDMTRAQLRKLFKGAPKTMEPWLRVNYYTLARPSEVVKVVHGQGEWVERGIFRLDRGKMDQRIKRFRQLVFSDVALKWLSLCDRHWSRLDSYSSAVRSSCQGVGPGALRHSGATHLHRLGVREEDVDAILGHKRGLAKEIYVRQFWRGLRQITARLTLSPDAEHSSSGQG